MPFLPMMPSLSRRASLALLGCFYASSAILSGCAPQEVLFCREGDCAERVIQEVDLATQSVHVAVYAFTNTDIAASLVQAASRPGVEVLVLTEETQTTSDAAQLVVRTLREGGIEPNLAFKRDCNCGSQGGIMHHKFAVIDGQTVLNGSYNYSCTATYCSDENILISRDQELAERFEAEFRYLYENGEPAL